MALKQLLSTFTGVKKKDMMSEKLESFNKKQQIGKTEILDFKSTVEKSTGYSQQKTANYRGKVW